MTPRKLILSCLLALLLLGLIGASSASAESAWWHLTSGSRPAHLRAGAGQVGEDQLQEIIVTNEGGQSAIELSVGSTELGFFVYPEAFANELGLTTLSAANLQTALEGPYGAGQVTVTEHHEGEVLSFKVTAPFGAALTANEAGVGSVEAKVINPGHAARPDGEIYLTAENLGEQTISGANSPVRIADVLPPGLKAVGIAATKPSIEGEVLRRVPIPCTLQTLSCTLSESGNETLAPFDQLEVRIAVDVEPGASSSESNAVNISGGEGFICKAVEAGSGAYKDSGCVNPPQAGSFDRVSSGPVAPDSISRKITVSSEPSPFGVEDYELTGEEDGGSSLTQAGAHPFQMTTTVTLNQGADGRPLENPTHKPSVNPVALPKDLSFNWPPGLIGNPTSFPQCTDTQFYKSVDSGGANACPPQSAVGVATVTVNEPSTAEVAQLTVPLFNMVPRRGEPARFGFNVVEANAPVVIDTAVRTGGDYGVTVSSQNITQTAALLSSQVTVWGVPGDPRHNRQRGWACLAESRGGSIEAPLVPCSSTATEAEQHPPAFLSMPTSCTGPMTSTVLGDSWSNPLPAAAFPTLASSSLPALEGCGRLPFNPSITVTPEKSSASTPSGLSVDVHVPQEQSSNANGLAEAMPKDITVALPPGVTVNPAAGNGLASCPESLAGFTGFADFQGAQSATFTETLPSPLEPGTNFCADASKVGTVKIKTPILPNPIEGSVYLATQNANPFGSLIALYLIAEDPVSGVLVKLVGETKLTEGGQNIATFANNPQAPFEDAEVRFFGGERAPLSTPTRCGPYTSTASLTPWSGNAAASASSTFNITSGLGGGPCPAATLPFAPSLSAGTQNINAGAFSPLSTTISRGDGQQAMQSVKLQMPAGLEGTLTGVALCPEANANAGSCSSASLIGESTVSAGVGNSPVTVEGGRVYLTEKYAGSPFGLSIVSPVKAGPFDLEHDTANPANQPACDCLVVRAKIDVNPITAQLTVTTDASGPHAIPQIIDGIPVQIKRVNVTVNREHFTFNPTSCAPALITGTILGYEGGAQPVSSTFQAANCATLKFAPKFAVATSAHTSKANGASLAVKLTYPSAAPGTYANLVKVKVSLPKQLPSRLTTLQKACVAAVFDANPTNCPKESIVGHAKVLTPVLPVPLEGNAYFVSHAAESFPDLTIVLQGYGITVELVGSTQIKDGITTNTFKATPDVPFSSFELNLPQGKFSALAANANLCASKLAMPTEFTAQNGALISQSTPISVSGCAKPLTNKQKLAKAIKACKKKRNKAKRATCEKQARKRYPVAKAKKKGSKKKK
jgi:hypothetical protein